MQTHEPDPHAPDISGGDRTEQNRNAWRQGRETPMHTDIMAQQQYTAQTNSVLIQQQMLANQQAQQSAQPTPQQETTVIPTSEE